MDLSPSLDAWLDHFATHVAPRVPWCLAGGRLRVDDDTTCCPLQQDWWQRYGQEITADHTELLRRYRDTGLLTSDEAELVMDAADEAPPYEAYAPEIVTAIRARLLAACGLEEDTNA